MSEVWKQQKVDFFFGTSKTTVKISTNNGWNMLFSIFFRDFGPQRIDSRGFWRKKSYLGSPFRELKKQTNCAFFSCQRLQFGGPLQPEKWPTDKNSFLGVSFRVQRYDSEKLFVCSTFLRWDIGISPTKGKS